MPDELNTPRLVINAPSDISEASAPNNDSRRYSLECVAVYPRSGLAVATDGRMASIVNMENRVTWEGPNEIDLPARILVDSRAFRKGKPTPTGKPGKPITISQSDWTMAEVGNDTYKCEHGTHSVYAPVGDVIKSDTDGYTVMGINPELLLKLAKSLNSGSAVTLLIDPENRKPMVLIPDEPNAADGIGILMPRLIGSISHRGSVGASPETVRKETSKRLDTLKSVLTAAESRASKST